jgi:iron complex outermembrane receptor protein
MPFRGFSVSLISKYVGRQYIDNTENAGRSLKGYFVNDITMDYHIRTKFVQEIILNASINNLTGTKYETNGWVYPYLVHGEMHEANGYFPQALINFIAGITIRL